MAVTAAADVGRWMTLLLVVVVQCISAVVGHSYRTEPTDDHHDHPPGNVWTNTRYRHFVRTFCLSLAFYTLCNVNNKYIGHRTEA